MPLRQFCWTKFGAEAGEEPEEILSRKEEERVANGGLFLWGIGNSIRPSLLALLDRTSHPVALFTPMLSPPAAQDRAPGAIYLWRSATGLDGEPFEIPVGSRVTSGLRGGRVPVHHYALVCRQDSSLTARPSDEEWLDDERLRNLRTGSRVGASQVTSVVERMPHGRHRRRYRIAFSAQLVFPFQVILQDCVPIGRLSRSLPDPAFVMTSIGPSVDT